ncbi:MAG: putative thioesterase [Clostridiales bacterium]|jgi:acyl-CoA thioester hydrolase|nr:putative thioesterase [Clostridiales bacterium]
MITKTFHSVRYAQIDQLGIVHHSNYPIWFEAARNDYFNKAGIPSSKIAALGFFLPLSHLNCEFKSPAKYQNQIVIITNMIDLSYVKLKFEYKILNRINEKIIATGKTVHVWTNRNVEPINIKKAAPEIFRILKQFSEAADVL